MTDDELRDTLDRAVVMRRAWKANQTRETEALMLASRAALEAAKAEMLRLAKVDRQNLNPDRQR